MKTVTDRINEIEKRLNNITPGKWQYIVDYDHFIVSDNEIIIAQTTYDDLSSSKESEYVDDVEFIANAPEDIKFLLNLVKSRSY